MGTVLRWRLAAGVFLWISNLTPVSCQASASENVFRPSRAMADMPCSDTFAVQNRRNCRNHEVARGKYDGLMYEADYRSRKERIANSVSPGSDSGPACTGRASQWPWTDRV
jgi:hypothetical protein